MKTWCTVSSILITVSDKDPGTVKFLTNQDINFQMRDTETLDFHPLMKNA